MARQRKVGNLLALAVLSYLTQQAMHPHELGRTLREHGDARSIKFNHGSLYMVVHQLAKAGFAVEQETTRAGGRPERTVYAITDAGREEQRDWLRELIELPQHEYPQFVAALAFVAALPPGEVVGDARRGSRAWAAGRVRQATCPRSGDSRRRRDRPVRRWHQCNDVLGGADGVHSLTRRLIDPAAPAGR